MSNNPTIKDVAKLAGVSTATVSRVMNNFDGVNTTTKSKVRNAMRELDYKVNEVARSLKTQSTKLIGFLVSDSANIFYNSIFVEMEKQLSPQGFSLLLCSSNNNEEEEIKKLSMLIERNVDGIILVPLQERNTYLQDLMKRSNIPLVTVDRFIRNMNVDKIVGDDLFGGYYLTKALIDEGYTRIGFIGGDVEVSNARLRYQGYLQAMDEAKLVVENDFVLMEGDTFQSGYHAMQTIFNRKNYPQAYVFENYMSHLGGTIYMYEEIPYEKYHHLAVASYDYMTDVALLKQCHYAMYQPLDKICEAVIQCLLNRISSHYKGEPRTIVIKPRLKVLVDHGGKITNPQLQDEVKIFNIF